jgi:anthranilate synthase component 2
VMMALRHRAWPTHGVQFHPESVLTGEGRHLLRNFLAIRWVGN